MADRDCSFRADRDCSFNSGLIGTVHSGLIGTVHSGLIGTVHSGLIGTVHSKKEVSLTFLCTSPEHFIWQELCRKLCVQSRFE